MSTLGCARGFPKDKVPKSLTQKVSPSPHLKKKKKKKAQTVAMVLLAPVRGLLTKALKEV